MHTFFTQEMGTYKVRIHKMWFEKKSCFVQSESSSLVERFNNDLEVNKGKVLYFKEQFAKFQRTQSQIVKSIRKPKHTQTSSFFFSFFSFSIIVTHKPILQTL